MTTLELRTSITADLDQMSVEMLENVSRYVKRLRRRTRNIKPQADATQRRREAAMLFVKNLSVSGGEPVPTQYRSAIEEQADCIVTRNKKDYKSSTIEVFTPAEFFERMDSK